jgi:hypothetical protein
MSGDPNVGPGGGDVQPQPHSPGDPGYRAYPPAAEISTKGLTPTQANIAVVGTVLIGIVGVLGGLAIIGFGIYMIINGVTGSVDFTMSSGNNQVQVKTVVIGVVVALIGLAVIWLTGIKINQDVKKGRKGTNR